MKECEKNLVRGFRRHILPGAVISSSFVLLASIECHAGHSRQLAEGQIHQEGILDGWFGSPCGQGGCGGDGSPTEEDLQRQRVVKQKKVLFSQKMMLSKTTSLF